MNRNPYEVLGVPRTASDQDVKKAFRKLAREHHPDTNPGDADAERRFKEINAANEILSDATRRAVYDEFGEQSQQPGFDPERARAWKAAGAGRAPRGGFTGQGMPDGFDVDDLLSGLFGGGPRRPREVRAELRTDLRTAVFGGERELTLGEGSPLKVRIPPGIQDGGRLRLRGVGPGGADLVLTVRVAPDARFEREGDDLCIRVPVTVREALQGARVEVPTLDGSVRLTVPALSQNGARLRVRGKGVPRREGPAGDLIVVLDVRLPEALDPEAAAALEALDRGYSGDLRAGLFAA